MANIKKSFNFRNGVQVDDDNLKVSATGLVGIGTTVPTESLDIRGNIVVSGVSSAVSLQAGVATITTLNPTEIIGAGVSIVSGIVTASSGIITFYGDARFLQGMPTSQWEDTDTGFGVTSIYNTGGNVGIATSNPQFTLQIGSNVNLSQNGVGISSAGDIKISGFATATGFVGALTGDVTGNVTGNLTGNVTGDVTGRITGDVVGNVNSLGVSTVSDLRVTDLNVDGHTNLDNVNIVGLTTFVNGGGNAGLRVRSFAAGTFAAGEIRVLETPDQSIVNGGPMIQLFTNKTPAPLNGPGDREEISFYTTLQAGAFLQDGSFQLNKNFNVAGISTFSGRMIGTATNNVIPFLYSNLNDLPSASTYHGAFAHVHATGRGYFAHAGQWWELVNKESDGRIGTGSEELNVGDIISSGIITATTELNSPLIGVGTAEPANDIQVRKTGNAEIQITSDTGTAGITVGREVGTSNTNNAELRYGGGSGFNYSSAQSVDIINYGTGNFNYHISAANAGNVDGDFHWHRGINNSRLMTLTGIGGSLGIGITTPSSALHVLGAATISGNVILGGNLDVTGNAALNVVGQVTGDLTGNVFANSGVSTFKRLDLDTTSYYEFGELSAAGVGIGTTMGNFKLVVNEDADKRFFITDSGNVGIKTDDIGGNSLFVSGDIVTLEALGVGTTQANSVVDFSNAGQNLTGVKANRMFMVPPKVTNAQRGNLTGLVSGAMIYNTNLNKLQVYNGSAWETITSS